jgi:alpha-galactosidase
MNKAIDEWGFRYLKLDFLYAGFLPGSHEHGTAAEHYERAIALLTEKTANTTGHPVAYLGCGLPLGSSYRHFPLSRIGTDTKESWDWPAAKLIRHEGRPSALLSLRDTIGRSFMNGTVFINDPDVIFLRSVNCTLSETEKELIALVNYLLASQIFCSDNFYALSKQDLSFTVMINELYEELQNDEYGATLLEKDVYRLESRSGKITGIINLSSRPFSMQAAQAQFSGGLWLVDHRLKSERHEFAPHSISVYKRGA